ncbi:ankyrin repeat-containing domain protein, partial [Obelidium mucronatum]
IVQLLLDNPNYFNPSCKESRPLRIASCLGYADVVELLLQNSGVDPSACNNDAIISAADFKHVSVVKILLQDRRVDPSARNNRAIVCASELGRNREMIRLLLVKLFLADPRVDPSFKDNSAIMYIVAFGHVDLTKRLLQDHRVDPACCENFPLRLATRRGYLEIVRLLLTDRHVDPVQEITGVKHMLSKMPLNLPFYEAIENQRIEISNLLLDDPRVNPGALPTFGMPTYLEFAMDNGCTTIINRLLAGPRLVRENPLFYATSHGLS